MFHPNFILPILFIWFLLPLLSINTSLKRKRIHICLPIMQLFIIYLSNDTCGSLVWIVYIAKTVSAQIPSPTTIVMLTPSCQSSTDVPKLTEGRLRTAHNISRQKIVKENFSIYVGLQRPVSKAIKDPIYFLPLAFYKHRARVWKFVTDLEQKPMTND